MLNEINLPTENKFTMKQFYLIFSIFLSSLLFSQSIYFVKKGGTGTGTSWDNALSELPTAVFGGSNSSRPLNNVRIYIAEGDYNFNATYGYTGNEVVIQGGFSNHSTGQDLSNYNPEIFISRILKNSNKRFINISTATSPTFDLNKFTVKGLYFKSTGSSTVPGNVINQQGADKYIQLKVEDCVFHDSRSGSAMIRLASSNSGKVTHWMHRNKFYGNQMGATGGFEYTTVNGDVKVLISNNLFGRSHATDGTGFYATTAGSSANSQTRFYIIGNVFSCATAGSTSGGIYFTTAGNALIKNNIFQGVQGKNYGGAIFLTASRGIQIEDNFFIQNSTSNTAAGAGGAIAVEGGIKNGSIIKNNWIKNNFFYENSINTRTYGGASISFSATTTSNKFDIIGNIFAYSKSNNGQLAAIQTRGNNIGMLRDNIFYGNRNEFGVLDPHSEIKASSSSNIEAIIHNKFQLPNASAYSSNNLGGKIAQGPGNVFNTSIDAIMGLKEGDILFDCESASLGCTKTIEGGIEGVAQSSKIGISTFEKQANNWPSENFDHTSINNGIIVLESSSKPFIVTRVNNPEESIGVSPDLKGALAYDTSRGCLMLFDGEKWGCLVKGCDYSIFDIIKNINLKP